MPRRSANGNVAGLLGNVGDEQRAAVQHAPASDTITGFQPVVVRFDGGADLRGDFEPAGIAAEQGDRTGVGGKGRDNELQYFAQGGFWIAGAGREACDPIPGGVQTGVGRRRFT